MTGRVFALSLVASERLSSCGYGAELSADHSQGPLRLTNRRRLRHLTKECFQQVFARSIKPYDGFVPYQIFISLVWFGKFVFDSQR